MEKTKKSVKYFGLRTLAALQACLLLLNLNAAAAYTDSSSTETTQSEYFTGQISGVDENTAKLLCDGDCMTAYKKADCIDITLSSERKFTAAYIMWNNIPESYTLTAQNQTVVAEDGFLHKLIEFDEPTDEFRLECKSGGELCDIYLFADSNYPDFVQRWEPPCKQADLLVLSTHADDEYLMFGGTIPYYAKELGLQVQVAYLTTHFDEQPRPHELLNGLWTAGVKNYPLFGVIGDIPLCPIYSLEEAAALYDFNEVLEWFVEQIRIYKPSVIVTHDINGEYGHGAHMLAAKTTQDAVAISADPNSFPDSARKYGVWDVPKTYLHFWGENKITMDWEQPLESFGGITAREAASLAYDQHKSQHKWEYIVGYWKGWDCRQFGLYRTLVGIDEKADFMDHIEPIVIEVVIEEETTVPETSPEPQTEPVTKKEEITEATVPPITAAAETTPTEPADNDNNDSSALVIILICAGAAVLGAVTAIVIKRKK